MLPALALAPLALAAVLVLSGLAKLRDPASTASMIALLRLPSVLRHRLVPRGLPLLELVTAALLLTPWPWTFGVGAVLSLLLFTAFLVVIARALTFDPRPTCGCFGRVGDHRVNSRTLVRNILLLALALVTAWLALEAAPAARLLAELEAGEWLWVLMAVALAAVAVLVLGRGPADPEHRHPPHPPVPAPASRAADEATEQDELDYEREPIPAGVLLSADLETMTLHRLARQRAQLLVLVNCWCGPTLESIDRLSAWRERLPELDVQLVHTQRPWDEPRLAGVDGVWWDPGSQVFDALRAGTSPAAVLLGADGLLAGGPVTGLDEIEQFVDDIAAELSQAAPEQAPIS